MNLFTLYLRTSLWAGHTDTVFRLTARWNQSPFRAVRNAARRVQKQLALQPGYFLCPSCSWATRKPEEHILVGKCPKPLEPAAPLGPLSEIEQIIHDSFVASIPEIRPPDQMLH